MGGGSYEKKTREIKRSLNRRARLRRNYFKMIGEDPKKKKDAEEKSRQIESGAPIDLDGGSSSESEGGESESDGVRERKRERKQEAHASAATAEAAPKKLTKKQLASRRRAEKYHRQKELQLQLQRKQQRREQHKNVMQATTRRGQPKLGSQIGVLLDKIKQQQQQ